MNVSRVFFVLVFAAIAGLSLNGQSLDKHLLINKNTITIVDYTELADESNHPIAYGKREFFNAITSAGGNIERAANSFLTQSKVHIIMGTLQNDMIQKLVSDEPGLSATRSEGIFYQWRKTDNTLALVIGGTDEKGLMYGLTELAQQIQDKGLIAITKIENTVEFPENKIRGVDRFIKDQNDDSWFFSEQFWQYYIKQLAVNRFNRLTLITGYNDGKNQDFMIPVYPYLFQVPGFNEITLGANITKKQDQYLAQLKRIGAISHAHGIEFVFGLWGHGRSDKLVEGLPENPEAYTKYCAEGMRVLLRQVPEIDGIQLRVNYESGVGGFGETAENFWKAIINAVGDIYNERNGRLFLDIRAKGITPKIRDWALETGIDLNVTSKYSWEGMGLAYHPTQMRKGELAMLDNVDKRQRYGYADFLKDDRNFGFIYRLWGIGTLRMLTWADADYAQRFSKTASFGNSNGFQVTPPLSRKSNTWNLFENDSLVYYTWEDERYWAYYTLFGRLGYSSNTNPDVWERIFKKHYGSAYLKVLDAYSYASKVLPLITSSHLTYHPANYNWAEMDSGAALFSAHNANPYHKDRTYQSAEPGDPGIFYTIEDYVNDALLDAVKPKINPIQLATLYQTLSIKTLEALAEIHEDDIPIKNKTEFKTNLLDLKILAALSSYHSFKTIAATNFAYYEKTQEKGYLKSCLNEMEAAYNSWNTITRFTGKTYWNKPLFLHDNGTWNDRLIEIKKDIQKIKTILEDFNGNPKSHWQHQNKPNILFKANFDAIVPKSITTTKDLNLILLTKKELPEDQTPRVHYRLANMALGAFKTKKMAWNGTDYVAKIPTIGLDSNYDLLVYFTAMDANSNVKMHPGIFNDNHEMPYYIIEIE